LKTLLGGYSKGGCTKKSESNSKHNSISNTYPHEVRQLQDLHVVLDHKPCLRHTKQYFLQHLLKTPIILDIWLAMSCSNTHKGVNNYFINNFTVFRDLLQQIQKEKIPWPRPFQNCIHKTGKNFWHSIYTCTYMNDECMGSKFVHKTGSQIQHFLLIYLLCLLLAVKV